MSAEQQNFSGGAVQTTLTAILHTTDLTMSVASTTNYPASGLPFVLTVDQGNAAAQESVFVRSWTGTTLTLDSVKGRGYDGTTASQHQVGAVVVHTPDAAFMADLSARAFAVTTQGDIPYVTASAGVVMGRLPIGSAYWVVASNGATPVYQSSPQSVFTGTGDLLYSSAPNTLARLAGSTANNGKVLVVSSGLPTWGTDPAVAAETARAELAEPAHFLSNTGDILIASASSTPSNLARGAVPRAADGGLAAPRLGQRRARHHDGHGRPVDLDRPQHDRAARGRHRPPGPHRERGHGAALVGQRPVHPGDQDDRVHGPPERPRARHGLADGHPPVAGDRGQGRRHRPLRGVQRLAGHDPDPVGQHHRPGDGHRRLVVHLGRARRLRRGRLGRDQLLRHRGRPGHRLDQRVRALLDGLVVGR